MSAAAHTDRVVGSRIRAQREGLAMSVSSLALASGLSRVDLEHIEQGNLRPEPEQLQRVAVALDTTLSALLKVNGD